MRMHNTPVLKTWLSHTRIHPSHRVKPGARSFRVNQKEFERTLAHVMAEHPRMKRSDAESRALYRILTQEKRRSWSIPFNFWAVARVLWALLVLLLLGAMALEAQGIILEMQNQGTPLAIRGGGLVILNCSTNVTCSFSGNTLTVQASSTGGGVPSGMISFVDTGSCPAGWTQISSAGSYFLATVAANGDAGTTGGSTSYTPSGTVSQPTFSGSAGTVPAETFTGTSGTVPAETISYPANVPSFSGSSGTVPAETISWPAGVPSFSGSSGTVPAETFTGTPFTSVINHTHTVTVTWNVQGSTTASTSGTHVMTSTSTGGSARAPTSGDVVSATTANPSGGVSSITPAGTNGTVSFTPAGTVAWPAGVPTNGTVNFTPTGSIAWPANPPTNSTASFTPAGTNGTVSFTPSGTVTQPNFSGSPATIQPTFYKVIPCRKN